MQQLCLAEALRLIARIEITHPHAVKSALVNECGNAFDLLELRCELFRQRRSPFL